MAKKQKTAFLQDLDTIQAYEIEEGLLSKYFNITDLPLELPMGKSSMLIMGSPELLNDVVLKIELVDSLGNPIYIEPVYDYSESNGVRVGIEVFKDTPAGAATLTILGELDPDYVDIPEQWQGTYNVKYTRTITVNKTIPNDRPVRFYKRPVLNVYEIIKGQVTQQSSTTGSNEQQLVLLLVHLYKAQKEQIFQSMVITTKRCKTILSKFTALILWEIMKSMIQQIRDTQ